MTITRRDEAVIRPTGDLCEDTIGPLQRALDLADGVVVIDLAEVPVVSAAAMRVLIQARRRLAGLRLVNASPLVQRSLEVCGLGELLA